MRQKGVLERLIAGALVVCCVGGSTGATEPGDKSWLALAEVEAKPLPSEQNVAVPAGWTKPVPLSFSIDYTLVTDYIFRGINFSEYSGEGREKLNHQVGVGLEFETKKFGVLGLSVWFEWFAGQERLTPDESCNLQEVDYSAYWRYEVEALATTMEFGWLTYHFPLLSGDSQHTHEWYVSLNFDDSKLLGTKEAVFNPSVAYYQDVDDFEGSWIEIGVSHDFALGEIEPLKAAPILKDITVTPSLTLGIDHRWMAQAVASGSDSTRLGNLLYGLDISYDLSGALKIPEEYGSISLAGFLYFSQALRDELIDDEFYGGMTVAYSW